MAWKLDNVRSKLQLSNLPCQFCDLPLVPEASCHDNGVVAMCLVVGVDALHTLNTRVLSRAVVPVILRLVPVKNATNKGADQGSTSISACSSLQRSTAQHSLVTCLR